MPRVGSAGSFTATDHVAVLDAAMAQVPAPYRRDVLVSIDGTGASRGVIEHLHVPEHRTRARGPWRRVEYSIGWPVDARTTSAIDQLGEGDWSPGLSAAGSPSPTRRSPN